MFQHHRRRSAFAFLRSIVVLAFGLGSLMMAAERRAAPSATTRPLRVLFIGNSFTFRHDLAELVKSMAAAGKPSVQLEVGTVVYGGRTMKDHWAFGSQNFVSANTLSPAEEQATIDRLEHLSVEPAAAAPLKTAIKNHRDLLSHLEQRRGRWDIVVLQSYRDDLEGESSSYFEFAAKFSAVAKQQGARVILYETTLDTQNALPLTTAPDASRVVRKAKTLHEFAARIGAEVVPMSSVVWECQTERPDLTLRYVKDPHPNHVTAYLTACTFYGVLFHRSPVGLPVDTVTDTRYLNDDHKEQDRDGGPITRTFSPQDRLQLQEIAWTGLRRFEKISEEVSSGTRGEATSTVQP